jgi:pterin-4a-carbinolamine dehydratase
MGRQQQQQQSSPAPGVVVLMSERTRLAPEGVQEHLARLPGWKLRQGGRGIERVRSFASSGVARWFVGRICELAEEHGQPIVVRLAGRQVTVTLQGHPGRGRIGGLTGTVFNLADQIG